MEQGKIKVGILPNQFLKSNGIFDKDEAIKLSGKIAGVFRLSHPLCHPYACHNAHHSGKQSAGQSPSCLFYLCRN